MLSYSDFLSLISIIDKNILFDAVLPELKLYRKIKFQSKDHAQNYRDIFQTAFNSTGGIGDIAEIEYQDIISGMSKMNAITGKYRASEKYAQWFYFFCLSTECDDSSYGQRISKKLFEGQSFYTKFIEYMRTKGIPRPSYLAPLKIVRLGPISISLGYDVGLTTLSLEETQNSEFFMEDIQSVFNALNWRSRLTKLHGRSKQYQQLLDWASDTTSKHAKIMLISGPGGSGKTRLVADAISYLVHQKNWSGGFLPHAISSDEVIAGGGKGVALIIDYPEERFELVKKILFAAIGDEEYEFPVRLILVSRENLNVWRQNLNRPYLHGIDEIEIGAVPFLSEKDALKIVDEVFDSYPDRIGKSKQKFKDVVKWLKQDHSHRLPLITLAASVHAVLEPEKGFTLNGKNILLALAEIELIRTRSYSMREFKNRRILEKLLALSILTPFGLSKAAIFDLGEFGICSGLNGNSVLEATENSPYWHDESSLFESKLIRLQPDRLAAAFLYLALDLNDPSPALPNWMGHAAMNSGLDFDGILARLSMDVGYFDVDASNKLEESAIEMLEHSPSLLSKLSGRSNENLSFLTSKFSIAIDKKILSKVSNEEQRAVLLNSIAVKLTNLGQMDEALKYSSNACHILDRLAFEEPIKYKPQLANAAQNLGNILKAIGLFQESLHAIELSVSLYHQLTEGNNIESKIEYSKAKHNLSATLGQLNRFEEALIHAQDSVMILSPETVSDIEPTPSYFAVYLRHLATILLDLDRPEEARTQVTEAIIFHKKRSKINPEIYNVELARSLETLSEAEYLLGDKVTALKNSAEALRLRRFLFDLRPETMRYDLAMSLNNIGYKLADLGKHDEALEHSKEAVRHFRILFEGMPHFFQGTLATSLRNLSVRFAEVGDEENALRYRFEAEKIRI